MNKFSALLLIIVMLVTTVISNFALAETGEQYLLPKFGFMAVDLNDADPLFSLGVLYGYGITDTVTLEGEVNLGFTGGGYKSKDAQGAVFDTGEYFIWTAAGYGVYRHSFADRFYFKGKLGLLYENVERKGDQSSDTGTGFGFAGGVGAGFVIGESLTLEAEITGIDEDIIFYSVGIHYPF